eukprot:TRINITY_DN8297_c0_g1_i1.p2 TRINITY_DN8297_c0_g1~~TRINITY_DN8297_c0_g1_i1.p2  ORF type:complete len:123 (-),score=12.19 TRINITY_DN8297_c0_g1_i1:176-544(-)
MGGPTTTPTNLLFGNISSLCYRPGCTDLAVGKWGFVFRGLPLHGDFDHHVNLLSVHTSIFVCFTNRHNLLCHGRVSRYTGTARTILELDEMEAKRYDSDYEESTVSDDASVDTGEEYSMEEE